MKVIFKKDVPGIGRMHDVKNVADGYAINFLFPRNLAVAASATAVKDIEKKKADKAAEAQVQENLLIKSLATLKDSTVTLRGKASEKGHLFSSIHAEDISKALAEQVHMSVDARFIKIAHPIKEVGEHVINVEVGERKGTFKLIVAALS